MQQTFFVVLNRLLWIWWIYIFSQSHKKNFILFVLYLSCRKVIRGGSRIFFGRGCTRLLLYFNTNKPHSFFLRNTSCIRKPQVILGGEGVRTPCTLPLDPPLVILIVNSWQEITRKAKRHLCWDRLSSVPHLFLCILLRVSRWMEEKKTVRKKS